MVDITPSRFRAKDKSHIREIIHLPDRDEARCVARRAQSASTQLVVIYAIFYPSICNLPVEMGLSNGFCVLGIDYDQ